MDIEQYQKSENFERNEAIYTLYAIDKKAPDAIAVEFNLTLEDVKKIIVFHKRYEAILAGAGV